MLKGKKKEGKESKQKYETVMWNNNNLTQIHIIQE